LKSSKSSFNIDLKVVLRIDDRGHEIGSASEMKKPIAISEWQISFAKIADVFLKKTEGATLPSRFQVFQPTGTEIIDPKNFVSICKEGIN
jgi:hypothetical protein